MKKTFFVVFLAVMALMLASGTSYATLVQGVCSGCHTMHNSQNGAPMAKNDDGTPDTTPNLALLSATCVYCHTNDDATTVAQKSRGAQVTNATESAAGRFSGTAANQHDVMTTDSVLGNNPPGGSALSAQLSCSGATGCHRSTGFHHVSSTENYRGLTGTVHGYSSSNREYGGATSTNHNVYKSDTNGISAYCATCHGTFHTSTGSAGAWTRHPTDNTIPSAWNADVDYNQSPFAFSTLGSISTTSGYESVANPEVACISCHKAHGTGNADILRFAYNMNAGDGVNDKGCENCHTKQR